MNPNVSTAKIFRFPDFQISSVSLNSIELFNDYPTFPKQYLTNYFRIDLQQIMQLNAFKNLHMVYSNLIWAISIRAEDCAIGK